jgi:hypothetical protein
VDHRARDAETLTLPARQFSHRPISQFLKVHQTERLVSSLIAVFGR